MIGNIQKQLGTLITEGRLGAMVRIGKLNNYFDRSQKKSQIFLTYSLDGCYVVHNSYLEGGIFNTPTTPDEYSKEYKLAPSEINNFYLENRLGFNFIFKKFSFIYTQTYTTPETNRTESHSYGSLTFYFKLDKLFDNLFNGSSSNK